MLEISITAVLVFEEGRNTFYFSRGMGYDSQHVSSLTTMYGIKMSFIAWYHVFSSGGERELGRKTSLCRILFPLSVTATASL